MKVRLYSHDFYEVRDDTPDDVCDWWMAAKIPGGWMIVDLLGQIVSASSELGQKIIRAITETIGNEATA